MEGDYKRRRKAGKEARMKNIEEMESGRDAAEGKAGDDATEKVGKDVRKRFRIGSILVIVFLLIYVPSLLHWILGKNIRTDIVRMGTIENSVGTEGYLVKDEEVLKSKFDGRLIPDVGEGERVPRNFRIATVLKTSSLTLLDKLKEKNLKIIEEQNKKRENESIFSEDVVKLDSQIADKVRAIIRQSNLNSLETMGELKADIIALTEKKASVIGGLTTTDAYINTLKKERDTVQMQINSNTMSVVSQTPGIISFSVDGYEELLNPAALDQLNPELLSEIRNSYDAKDIHRKDVSAEKPFAKIIKGGYCYVAVVLDEAEAAGFKAGDSVDLRINDINKVVGDVRIDYMSEKMDGKYIAAVKIDKYLSEIVGLRKISVDLVRNAKEGLKVPMSCLFNVSPDGKEADIFLVKANCASKRRVEILLKNKDYAIIGSIKGDTKGGVSLYDIYILHPENIEEEQIISR